jgi:chromate transporter
MNPVLDLSASDWLSLFNHFATLSLLAVGGAITVAPDMHRFLVEEKLWLSESQFTSSIALAQAAPGPNILFVALMGYNVGMNAGAGLGGG